MGMRKTNKSNVENQNYERIDHRNLGVYYQGEEAMETEEGGEKKDETKSEDKQDGQKDEEKEKVIYRMFRQ